MSLGKSTGAPLNRKLMQKMLGVARGEDVSNIKVNEEQGIDSKGIKPTVDEVERWRKTGQMSEVQEQQVQNVGPAVRVHDVHKNTIAHFLKKQSTGAVPVASAPTIAGRPLTGGGGEHSTPSFDYKNSLSTPIPDTTKPPSLVALVEGQTPQYRAAADRSAAPGRIVVDSSVNPSLVESQIIEDLPVQKLKKMLHGLGEAMVESAGGKFGLLDYFPFSGTSFEVVFQHKVMESAGETGLQVSVVLNPSNVVSKATVEVTLKESAAVGQSVCRSYLDPEQLIEDLPNLIDLAGMHV
jgi:hypothetical protein